MTSDSRERKARYGTETERIIMRTRDVAHCGDFGLLQAHAENLSQAIAQQRQEIEALKRERDSLATNLRGVVKRSEKVEAALLEVMEKLERERDEARKQVQFMVEKAASGGALDGYRELGQKCAALEARCEEQANFIESAFDAHPNLDVDIAALQGEQGG